MSLRQPSRHSGHALEILLVECDPARGPLLRGQLAAEGHHVRLAVSSEHARVLATHRRPELLLLGGLDPPGAGLALLREIRRGPEPGDGPGGPPPGRVAAIVLAGPAGHDPLRAFEAGADDYVCDPLDPLELRARLRALIARADSHDPGRCLHVGSLYVDTRSRRARMGERPLALRRLEYELLVCLAREPGRVFKRQELLERVWGYRSPGSTRTLDSHASRLRRKLDPDRSRGWVVSVRGIGYRLI